MAASKQQVKFYFPELSKIFPPTYFWPKIAWFHGCKEPRDMEDRPFFSSTKPSVSQNLVTCPHLREQSSCDSLKKKKKKKKSKSALVNIPTYFHFPEGKEPSVEELIMNKLLKMV